MKKFTLSILLLCVATFALGADQPIPSSRPPIRTTLVEINKADPIKLQITVSSEGSKAKEAFLGIPDLVLSGLLGSLIAATSAALILVISNRNSRLTQAEDHQQETRENQRTRKHELRNEVYLGLAEVTIAAHSYYTKIAISELDKELDMAPHNALLTLLFKIVIVAEPQTQAVAHSLVTSYGKLFFTSLEWRVKFINVDQKLKAEPTSVELQQRQSKLRNEFMDAFMTETAPIRKLQAKLLTEVKRELGVESDLSELEQQFDKMADSAIIRYKEFIQNISR